MRPIGYWGNAVRTCTSWPRPISHLARGSPRRAPGSGWNVMATKAILISGGNALPTDFCCSCPETDTARLCAMHSRQNAAPGPSFAHLFEALHCSIDYGVGVQSGDRAEVCL